MYYLPEHHILFEEKWLSYTESYQTLKDMLHDKGIDSSLLDDCLEEAFALADLSADEAFVIGYEKGRRNGKTRQIKKAPTQVV